MLTQKIVKEYFNQLGSKSAMGTYTYEQAVQWLRSVPENTEFVKLCYLDEDNSEAAKRFASSEEFSEVTQLLNLQKSTKPLKILDMGCGNGIASYALASLGHEVCAIDPDLSNDVGLEATRRLAYLLPDKGSIKTFQAFAESLPFADSTFDVIYARQALHHFSDLKMGLSECSRVLKKDGLFLATREHVVSNEQQLQTFLNDHVLHQLHGGENAYSVETYLKALQQAKLSVLKCFPPFDTVINHFPTSNAQIKERLINALTPKVGKRLAVLLSQLSWLKSLYRQRLSKGCQLPGRLYSFFCKK